MKSDAVAALTLYLPASLRERARVIVKKLRTSTNQLARDAITEKVEFYEAKFRKEKQDREQEEAAKRDERKTRRMLNNAPKPPAPPSETKPDVVEEKTKLDLIYEQTAAKILRVIDKPTEKRLLALEAIGAIKKEAPLTHPSDAVIIARLEQEVLALQRAASKTEAIIPAEEPVKPLHPASALTRIIDALTGRTIDTSKIKSFGDIDDDAEKSDKS
jgi:hypothetical protein